MKLIINENQLINLIKERSIRLGGDETYSGRNYDEFLVNKLLEKIKSAGFDSLTSQEKDILMKMSRGEPIETGPEEKDEPSKTPYIEKSSEGNLLYQMFIIHLPDEIDVFGEKWQFYAMDIEGDVVPIVATNGTSEIFMMPFPEPNKNTIEFGKQDGGKKMSFPVDKIPQTEEDMAEFVELFLDNVFPVIVKAAKKNT
jgi:hypothetical protein